MAMSGTANNISNNEGAREIVLDTETTGLDPTAGHRVVEIACIELVNRVPTGKVYQAYLNPERDMPAEALAVHGLTNDFLARHPKFAEVAEGFLDFVGDSCLVIHNAEFDLKFLNWELEQCGRACLACQVVDTVLLARKKFPGAPASLDALCRRFGIDNSARKVHGALLDAELLADVYVELMGGRQAGLGFTVEPAMAERPAASPRERAQRTPRPHAPSAEELAAHAAFIKALKDPVWME